MNNILHGLKIPVIADEDNASTHPGRSLGNKKVRSASSGFDADEDEDEDAHQGPSKSVVEPDLAHILIVIQ